jgi:hypothetical protein
MRSCAAAKILSSCGSQALERLSKACAPFVPTRAILRATRNATPRASFSFVMPSFVRTQSISASTGGKCGFVPRSTGCT